jgi:hypothetical protein
MLPHHSACSVAIAVDTRADSHDNYICCNCMTPLSTAEEVARGKLRIALLRSDSFQRMSDSYLDRMIGEKAWCSLLEPWWVETRKR